jgi:hypothetical protein
VTLQCWDRDTQQERLLFSLLFESRRDG